MKPNNIRNFSIVAHIDHGKSTLADRLIDICYNLNKKQLTEQYLDDLELEKKRGITIKLNYIRLEYLHTNNQKYILNLIDTPGHVDFTYEVSRSLAACEGALLVVDATQGIQAQTLSNVDLCLENNLEILPVINKIDLQQADIKETKDEIEQVIGLNTDGAPLISAKNNLNIGDVLKAIIDKIPPPKGKVNAKFQALIFDTFYDTFKGTIFFIKVISGNLKTSDDVFFINSEAQGSVRKIYYKTLEFEEVEQVSAGDVAMISCNFKRIDKFSVGDTVIKREDIGKIKALPKYRKISNVVFSSFYPIDSSEYENLSKALHKIKINDDSLNFESENSQTLGFGFRCGFLGGLHLEIIKERLELEYNLEVIAAFPTVRYNVYLKNGKMLEVINPYNFPKQETIEKTEEPFCNLKVITPIEYYGVIFDYSLQKRAVFVKKEIINEKSMLIYFSMPLAEIIIEYFDKIKSISKGYATLDYEIDKYQPSDLVRVDFLLNNEIVEPFSMIVSRKFAYPKAKIICETLKKLIPKHSFEVPVQAAINRKIIARETIKATRKDVTAKLYGGDVTRKKKLLEKQKKGKKRMRSFGKVNIPHDVFVKVTKMSE